MRAWIALLIGLVAAGEAGAQATAYPRGSRSGLPSRGITPPAAGPSDTNVATLAPLAPRTDDMPAPVVQLADPQPASVKLTWNAIVGASGYRIYRNDLGLLTPADLPLTQTSFVHEAANDYRLSYSYGVVALYPNGHTGPSAPVAFTPPKPENATELEVNMLPAHVTEFTWEPPIYQRPAYFLLLGPGLDEGIKLPATARSYREELGLRPGLYTYTLAAMYGPGPISTPANEWPTAKLPVAGGRYRLTIVGFTVTENTRDDDPMSFDGKGDEVMVAAATRVYDFGRPGQLRTQVVRSRVYGDANRAPTRIQAGTQSPLGGLRDGDQVLVQSPPPGLPRDSVLPLVAWEGDLVDDDVVVLRANVFEVDREPPGPGNTDDFARWQKDMTWYSLGAQSGTTDFAMTYLLSIPALAQDLRNKEPAGAMTGLWAGGVAGVGAEANRGIGRDRAITFSSGKASFFADNQVPIRLPFDAWDRRGGKYLLHIKVERVQ